LGRHGGYGAATDRRQAHTGGELESFGFQLRVKSPHLAALLTGADDRVSIVRAREQVPHETRTVPCDSRVSWRSAQGRRAAWSSNSAALRPTAEPPCTGDGGLVGLRVRLPEGAIACGRAPATLYPC